MVGDLDLRDPSHHDLDGAESRCATLDLAGSGFTASSIITSVKVGGTAVTPTPASPPTSTNGSFSGVTFVVPAIAAGTYVVTVKDASANVATVQLIVT